jgi:hypothetical protein
MTVMTSVFSGAAPGRSGRRDVRTPDRIRAVRPPGARPKPHREPWGPAIHLKPIGASGQ